MKVLTYGMQSSGATLFNYLLSQRENTIAILDLFCNEICPSIDDKKNDIFIKCTISNFIDLQQHLDSFNPDLVILFKRNVDDVVRSLQKKDHANRCGNIEEKIEKYNQILNEKKFDIEYSYEEMMNKKICSLKKIIDNSSFDFKRTVYDVIEYNCLNSFWCKDNLKKKWWIGCLRHKEGKVKLNKNIKL